MLCNCISFTFYFYLNYIFNFYRLKIKYYYDVVIFVLERDNYLFPLILNGKYRLSLYQYVEMYWRNKKELTKLIADQKKRIWEELCLKIDSDI